MSKESKSFTPNEVAALVEELKSEFRVVAEGVTGIDERLETVEERLSGVEEKLESVKERLTGVEDAVRVAIPSLTSRVTKLEAKVGV